MSIMSVFFMSTQPLVIAPRPNVGPKLETVGRVKPWPGFPYARPRGRASISPQVVELIGVGTAADPRTDSSRFTVCPAASFSTKVSSRVFFTRAAISLIASSHEMSCHSVPPGRRTCGFSKRRSFMISCCSEEPWGTACRGWSDDRGSLDVHHLRGHILRAVADGVDDGAAAHRAVRAGRTRFGRPRDFQRAQLCVGGLQVESKHGRRAPPTVVYFRKLRREGFIGDLDRKERRLTSRE